MTNKPNIVLLKDIVLPFVEANHELALIKHDIDNSKEQRQVKSLFLYSYAIFESTLVQSYSKILYAFPERMKVDKIDFAKYKDDIISNGLSHTLVQQLSIDFSQNLMYGKISDGLKKYANTLQIPILYKKYLIKLEEIKRYRNAITHDNPINTNLKSDFVDDHIFIIYSVLNEISQMISSKYIEFTFKKLVQDSWNYLFDSPLLSFEAHWIFDEFGEVSHYNFEYLKKVAFSLCSSERTFLILFMSNYCSQICNEVYNLTDISMPVSILNRDKVAYITELFDRYPLLLQNYRNGK